MANPTYTKINDNTFAEEVDVPTIKRLVSYEVKILEAKLQERTNTKNAIDAEITVIKDLLKEAKKLGMIVKAEI